MAEENKQMDLQKVEQLITMMTEHDLVEVEIMNGDEKIHLKRPGSVAPSQQLIMQLPAASQIPVTAAPQEAQADTAAKDEGLVDIPSPMIGTFYVASNADSEPYVQSGDHVSADTVICIIEAMKVMNEIKAETTGTIVEMLADNGQAVEFGQTLFTIRPD